MNLMIDAMVVVCSTRIQKDKQKTQKLKRQQLKKKKSESDRETAYGLKILTHHRMTVTWRYDQNKELNKSFETVFIHVHVENIILKQNNKTANEIQLFNLI